MFNKLACATKFSLACSPGPCTTDPSRSVVPALPTTCCSAPVVSPGFAPCASSLLLTPCWIADFRLSLAGRVVAELLPFGLSKSAQADLEPQSSAQSQQILDLGARPAPLFPVAHSDTPSDPLVQLGDRTVILADAEVRRPASKILPQFVQPVLHGYAPASSREFLDPVLEVRQGLIGPAYLLALDREAQEIAFAHRCHFAFDKVDLEFEGPLQIPRDGVHHPLRGALAPRGS